MSFFTDPRMIFQKDSSRFLPILFRIYQGLKLNVPEYLHDVSRSFKILQVSLCFSSLFSLYIQRPMGCRVCLILQRQKAPESFQNSGPTRIYFSWRLDKANRVLGNNCNECIIYPRQETCLGFSNRYCGSFNKKTVLKKLPVMYYIDLT